MDFISYFGENHLAEVIASTQACFRTHLLRPETVRQGCAEEVEIWKTVVGRLQRSCGVPQMGSGGLGREDVLELCLAVLHVKTKRAALEAVQLTPEWATFFWSPPSVSSHRIEARRHISNGH